MSDKKKERKIVNVKASDIKPYEGSHKTLTAMNAIKESINKYGITQPVILDKDNVVVAGNAVYKAAVECGVEEIPCIYLNDLSEDEIAEYRIADNKTSEFAKWNESKLKKELSYLGSPTDLQFCFDEDINKFIGFEEDTKRMFDAPAAQQPAPAHSRQEEAAIKRQQDDAFRRLLRDIDDNSVAQSRTYRTFVCSKCGKNITIKA